MFEQHDLETARGFFDALNPGRDDWADGKWAWAFRGQGDASWGLVPSVLRRGPGGKAPWESRTIPASHDALSEGSDDVKVLEDLLRRDDVNDLLRQHGEIRLILEFRDRVDRVGLPIPDDSAALRSWRRLQELLGGNAAMGSIPNDPETLTLKPWPPGELLSVVALAQHYGVPTRLLDWTWKPRVAAYFAARDVMKREAGGAALRGFGSRALRRLDRRRRDASSYPCLQRHPHKTRPALPERLAVWAISTALADPVWLPKKPDSVPRVELVHAPMASNPNLAAQAGLFTLARFAHEDVGLESVFQENAAKWVRFRFAPEQIKSFKPIKVTLPASEARSLMRLLSYEGVTAATVFPGYRGVVESMEEERWWRGAS